MEGVIQEIIKGTTLEFKIRENKICIFYKNNLEKAIKRRLERSCSDYYTLVFVTEI